MTSAQRETLLKYQPFLLCPGGAGDGLRRDKRWAQEGQEMGSGGTAPLLVFVTHLHRPLRVGASERSSCSTAVSALLGLDFSAGETPSGFQLTYKIFQFHLDVLLIL